VVDPVKIVFSSSLITVQKLAVVSYRMTNVDFGGAGSRSFGTEKHVLSPHVLY